MGPQARGRAAKIAGVAGITLLVAACGSSSSSNSAKSKVSAAAHSTRNPAMGSRSPGTSGAASGLKPERSTHGNFLATGQGFTLYGFTRDSTTASACTGACAQTFHPLTGTPRAAAGVSLPGTLGTITRSGGVRQATFDGHPLYTFKDDTVPGDAKGNGNFQFGGRWLAIPVSSAVVPVTPSRSATASATPSATASATMAPTSSATRSPSRGHRSGAGP